MELFITVITPYPRVPVLLTPTHRPTDGSPGASSDTRPDKRPFYETRAHNRLRAVKK